MTQLRIILLPPGPEAIPESHNKSSPIKWRLPCITTTRRQSFSQMDSFSRGAHLTGYVRLPQAPSGTGHHPPKYEI